MKVAPRARHVSPPALEVAAGISRGAHHTTGHSLLALEVPFPRSGCSGWVGTCCWSPSSWPGPETGSELPITQENLQRNPASRGDMQVQCRSWNMACPMSEQDHGMPSIGAGPWHAQCESRTMACPVSEQDHGMPSVGAGPWHAHCGLRSWRPWCLQGEPRRGEDCLPCPLPYPCGFALQLFVIHMKADVPSDRLNHRWFSGPPKGPGPAMPRGLSSGGERGSAQRALNVRPAGRHLWELSRGQRGFTHPSTSLARLSPS